MKTWAKVGLGGFAALMVIAIVTGDKHPPAPVAATPSPTPSAAPVPQALPVTAEALGKAYDENELAARDRFEGKPLLITGTVTSITSTFGEPTLALQSSHLMSASFKDATPLKALKAGQRVTLRCDSLEEAVSILYPKNCRIEAVPNGA